MSLGSKKIEVNNMSSIKKNFSTKSETLKLKDLFYESVMKFLSEIFESRKFFQFVIFLINDDALQDFTQSALKNSFCTLFILQFYEEFQKTLNF